MSKAITELARLHLMCLGGQGFTCVGMASYPLDPFMYPHGQLSPGPLPPTARSWKQGRLQPPISWTPIQPPICAPT